EPAQDPDGQATLRVLRLLGGRGDRVEPDVREEYDRRPLMHAAEAVWSERMIVRRVEVSEARDDEQTEHQELDRDHDVVYRGALANTEQQQPRDRRDDQEGGHIDEDRDAGDVGRGLAQAMDRGVRGADRRP